MRVLVAGATGVVGRHLVPLLAAAGHSVVGLTRTAAKAAVIRELGAEQAIADGLDRAAIHRAVVQARPEIVVHEMTALTGVTDLRRFDRAFAVTDRLRTEGTDHLVAAATAAGVRRIVAQSYCGWPYARTGGPIKSESDPLDPSPPRAQRRTLAAIRHLETAVTGAAGMTGIVLRYGTFYGPNTGMLLPAVLDEIRRGRLPLIGDVAAGGRFCTSRTRRRRRWRRSNAAQPASTISSTTNRWPRANGCRPWRKWPAPGRRAACLRLSRACSPARRSSP